MSWHRDREVNQAFIGLMDALVSWERNTGRGSKLFFIPDNLDEEIIFMMDGKPLADFSYSLIISQLEVVKNKLRNPMSLPISTSTETPK